MLIPLVRLEFDAERGYRPESSTAMYLKVLRYEYCAWRLARKWLSGELAYTEVRLPEFDDFPVQLNALCVKKLVYDFVDMCEDFLHGRENERCAPAESEFMYHICPGGLTGAFGGYSNTPAWMFLDQKGPALLLQRDDNLEEHTNKWLSYWASTLDVSRPWPKKTQETEGVMVPQEYLDKMVNPRIERRRRKKKGRVRAFLRVPVASNH